MCDKCAKTFHSEAHIKRHFLTTAHINRHKKQGSSRWKVMRHVKRLLKDTQYSNELKKQTKGIETGSVDSSVVEAIMSQIREKNFLKVNSKPIWDKLFSKEQTCLMTYSKIWSVPPKTSLIHHLKCLTIARYGLSKCPNAKCVSNLWQWHRCTDTWRRSTKRK